MAVTCALIYGSTLRLTAQGAQDYVAEVMSHQPTKTAEVSVAGRVAVVVEKLDAKAVATNAAIARAHSLPAKPQSRYRNPSAADRRADRRANA